MDVSKSVVRAKNPVDDPSQFPHGSVSRELQTGVTIKGYEYVGEGYCRDSNSVGFDYIYKDGISSSGDCGIYCSSIQPTDFLRGFHLISSRNRCVCQYEDGQAPPKPADAHYYSTSTGTGEITHVQVSSGIYCYKVVSSSLETAVSESKLDMYAAMNITNDGCSAGTDSTETSAKCTFKTNNELPASATFYSKITAGACIDEANSAFKTSAANATNGVPALTTPDQAIDVTDDEKNCKDGTGFTKQTINDAEVCVVKKSFCARGDIVDDNNGSPTSVLAEVLAGEVTYKYASNGNFNATIETSSFDPKEATADATRTVSLKVFKESCSSDSKCDLVSGNTCFGDGLMIGNTLDLCIKPSDANTDVKVISLKSVTVTPSGSSATTIVSEDEVANFVTTFVADDTSKGVSISTLMTPSYYDAQGGVAGSVSVAGTAILEYTSSGRRVLVGFEDRKLQSGEESYPFAVSVPISKNEVPAVAQVDEESGAGKMGVGVGMAAMIGGAAIVLF